MLYHIPDQNLHPELFFFLFRDKASMWEQGGGGAGGEGETESQAGSSLNMEPDARALYQDPEIVT